MLLPPQAEPLEEQAETAQEFYPEVVSEEPLPPETEPEIKVDTDGQNQDQDSIRITELPDQGNGVLRVEIGPEEQPAPTPKGKKHLRPAEAAQDKPSLF